MTAPHGENVAQRKAQEKSFIIDFRGAISDIRESTNGVSCKGRLAKKVLGKEGKRDCPKRERWVKRMLAKEGVE